MEGEKDKWIEKALNSLEGIEPAIPAVNMHTRIMRHLQAERFRIVPDTVSTATVYRIAAGILLILALNVLACVAFSKGMTEKKGLQSFAREYSISDSNEGLLNI